MARYKVFKDKKGEWRFDLIAGNGEVIASSEGYKTKQGALKGIRAVKRSILAKVTIV